MVTIDTLWKRLMFMLLRERDAFRERRVLKASGHFSGALYSS
jgi:hypothetical protein